MNNHMETATVAATYAISELDTVQNLIGLELTRLANTAITAALPHLRAMIAEEVSEGFSPETGGEELLLYEITAQIAERNQT